MSSPPPGTSDSPLHCSFCGKSSREVHKLIAGPSVYICDECVGLCSEILEGENLPARVRSPAAVPWARRDSIVVEVRRAIESAFPDRADQIMRELETLIPPGGPLICHDCREARSGIPDPCPENFVCADWREATWTGRGYVRAEGIPVAWPWLQVLERRTATPPAIEYVLLAPLLLRRPVLLSAAGAATPPGPA